jgi:hypothetical protein
MIGIPTDVDQALTDAPAVELLRTQTTRAAYLRTIIDEHRSSAGPDTEPVLSSTSDGLLMMLRPV